MGGNAPLHSVSVAAAIIRGDRVLAIQRQDNGAWEPPGGVLEVEETIATGLQREVKEETGLDVVPVNLTGVYKNMARGIVALVFRCEVVGGEAVSVTDETKDLRWLTRHDVTELVQEQKMTEAFAVRLLDALDHHAVRIRAHDGVALLDS